MFKERERETNETNIWNTLLSDVCRTKILQSDTFVFLWKRNLAQKYKGMRIRFEKLSTLSSV